MRLVCLSDTHNRHCAVRVPPGDVVIHAGDATLRGAEDEVAEFTRWFRSLPHATKVLVAGNHDWLFQRDPARARALLDGIVYLEDSGTRVGGLALWGSPWQPWFLDWAFNLPRGAPLRARWDRIPPGTDVLITHGPPQGIRDTVERPAARGGPEATGCEELLAAVRRLRPRVHLFGHIHEGYGQEERDGTRFVNASICDRAYRVANAPIVVDV